MVTIKWNGKLAFEASTPSGAQFILDGHPDFGGQGLGPTPLEALLCALGACTGMDVISILEKKRQVVTRYTVEVTGERAEEGSSPRPYVSLHVKHIVEGENLDPASVQRAVELSDEKYCHVAATLRGAPKITREWVVS
jgi:putative redox protein